MPNAFNCAKKVLQIQPVTSNNTEEGRAQNRRTDFSSNQMATVIQYLYLTSSNAELFYQIVSTCA